MIQFKGTATRISNGTTDIRSADNVDDFVTVGTVKGFKLEEEYDVTVAPAKETRAGRKKD